MANTTNDKGDITYAEDIASPAYSSNNNNALHTLSTTVDAAALPKGYFHSRHFLGSFLAVMMSLTYVFRSEQPHRTKPFCPRLPPLLLHVVR